MIVTLLTIHLLVFAVWVGSLVALPITVRQLKAVADLSVQAKFFPKLGRTYGKVGTTALAIAIVSGAVLAGSPADWAGQTVGAVITGVVVLGITMIGMIQARRVGRLRTAIVHGEATGDAAQATLHREVRITDALRGLIVVGTLIGVVLEAATIAAA